MSEVREPQKGKRKAASGLFIPAGLFIGLGIGFLLDNLVPWLFIGLGAGFLVFALFMLLVRD